MDIKEYNINGVDIRDYIDAKSKQSYLEGLISGCIITASVLISIYIVVIK